tara:strand:- start:31883 stop:32053 length:171 start_codon:yes stop_codon:yes gene_type:complete
MKKWMVYFLSKDGYREGNEYIFAETRQEAVEIYQRYFNVPSTDNIKAIPVVDPVCS